MLKLEIDDAALNLLQKQALDSGGNGIRLAKGIMKVRTVLDNLVPAFNRNQMLAQKANPALVISDGAISSLKAALSPPNGKHVWPRRSCQVLQGLLLADAQPMPGNTSDKSYYCPMMLGPAQERQFGAYSLILAYDHIKRIGRICWIGLNEDVASAMADLTSCADQA